MTARIYKPTKAATQSGWARTKAWRLEFEPTEPCEIDPLMGWTSSGDMKTQVLLRFATKEEAVAYCERKGIDYRVEESKPEKRTIMAYSDNFKPGRIGLWTH